MKLIKKSSLLLLVAIVILFTNQVANAQEERDKINFDASVDLMSRFIWRGLNLGGSSPSIQPCLELNAGNFSVGSWAALSTNSLVTNQEVDLYASYTIADMFSITLMDYFTFSEDSASYRYFDLNKDETSHVLELSVEYLGTEKVPLNLLIATNIYGNDAKRMDGSNLFSTYIEAGYSFDIKETSCNAFLGYTPTKPDLENGMPGYYGDDAGIINLGISAEKEIKITDHFCLPLKASLITNPQAENIFLVVGVTL